MTVGEGIDSEAAHLVDISTGERRRLARDEVAREVDLDLPMPLYECGNRRLRMTMGARGEEPEGIVLEEGGERSMLFEFRTTSPLELGVGAVNDMVFSLHCGYLLVQLGYQELWIVEIATRRRAKIFSGYLMQGRVRPAAGTSHRP